MAAPVSPSGPPSSGPTSSTSGSGGSGPYTLCKFLSGGTYATGTDWKSQFENADFTSRLVTAGGEMVVTGTQASYGICGGFALTAYNPFDSEILILEASIANPVQVYVNDALIDEVDAPGTLALSFQGGINKLEIIRAVSPLVILPSLALLDPFSVTNAWASLYAAGSDPFIGKPKPGFI